jgi:prepilin-type N-terminal cleavage/methylation domain-containing protein
MNSILIHSGPPMSRITAQRGFTLVEIAIVLVIIGLLLGGILKGQELITAAKVRNIADQNSGVQAAYWLHRSLPPDPR